MTTEKFAAVPFQIDQVIIVCRICKNEHALYPDDLLRSASAVQAFLDKHIVRFCDCPATHCDVKLRLRCRACPHASHDAPCKQCGCGELTEPLAAKHR